MIKNATTDMSSGILRSAYVIKGKYNTAWPKSRKYARVEGTKIVVPPIKVPESRSAKQLVQDWHETPHKVRDRKQNGVDNGRIGTGIITLGRYNIP